MRAEEMGGGWGLRVTLQRMGQVLWGPRCRARCPCPPCCLQKGQELGLSAGAWPSRGLGHTPCLLRGPLFWIVVGARRPAGGREGAPCAEAQQRPGAPGGASAAAIPPDQPLQGQVLGMTLRLAPHHAHAWTRVSSAVANHVCLLCLLGRLCSGLGAARLLPGSSSSWFCLHSCLEEYCPLPTAHGPSSPWPKCGVGGQAPPRDRPGCFDLGWEGRQRGRTPGTV